jgi:hypothetical protein
MKIHGKFSSNGTSYYKGDEIPWYKIYPFFLIHMLAFGASGFFLAYAEISAPVQFRYMHGGIAILVYTVFYFTIFGRDEVKWMFINAALGILGICTQIDWLLSLFGKKLGDYPINVHVIPFLYYILYTFLLRQAFLDFTKSREDDKKKKRVEYVYVAMSVAIYGIFYFL